MNELKVINETAILGQNVRVYGTIEEPLFLAKDVAEWIDYAKTGNGNYDVSRMLGTVDEEEKLIRKIFVSGQNRDMWFLTEDGLYEILMQSTKPIAKQFKREIKNILKNIRKHGVYATDEFTEKAIADPDFAIRVFTALKEEKEKVAQLKAEAKKNLPATLTGQAVESSTNGILIGQYAPRLQEAGWDIGSSRLFKEFREDGFLCSQKGLLWNKPSQFCLENGYMKYRTSIYTNSKGEQQTSYTPLVTGKGQVYFLNYYKNKYGF